MSFRDEPATAGTVAVGTQTSGLSVDDSTSDVAKDQAGQVKDTAVQAGAQVAGTAKEQAGQVAGEAKSQARDLISQSQRELREQAGQQQQRVAGGLRSLGDELHAMASGSDQQGLASDLARQVAGRAHDAAGWLDGREPGALLDETRAFARQRPGAFLALAAGAGLLVGRLGRGLADDARSDDTDGTIPSAAPAATTTPATAGLPTRSSVESPDATWRGPDRDDLAAGRMPGSELPGPALGQAPDTTLGYPDPHTGNQSDRSGGPA